LEEQLSRIFDSASRWNALLLLDEADAFLQSRSIQYFDHNRLVAVFLRKLEQFAGVMFLTTNLFTTIDSAILDRIHLRMQYDRLSHNTKRKIFVDFLPSAGISDEEFDRLANFNLNGREVSPDL
jgi:SpoVK/Ycf46/Vps4 family AAA+-type ATPase